MRVTLKRNDTNWRLICLINLGKIDSMKLSMNTELKELSFFIKLLNTLSLNLN